MKLLELVFRELNVVLVHGGTMVPAISLDRVRMARPSSNIQVNTGSGVLSVIYPDERMVVQFDQQRVTVTDTSTRGPEQSSLIDTALAQYGAIGSPTALAFGFNIRADFEVEGMEWPGMHLVQGVIREPDALAAALRTNAFQAGLNLLYRRGVKLWTFRLDPLSNTPNRLQVHANIHEDLQPAPPATAGPPPPPWLGGGSLDAGDGSLPGLESLKADLAVQSRSVMDTVAALLALANRA